MNSWSSRTELILGEEKFKKLQTANVLIVGVGGVGGYAAENICRAGVGKMTIIDSDDIDITNINRQLPALSTTVGQPKVDVLRDRFLSINPNLEINIIKSYLVGDKITEMLKSEKFDYIVDAIDTLNPKIELLIQAYRLGIPIVSSMGAGNKMDPNQVKVVDISKSHNCSLAKVVRKGLHRNGIYKGIKVVFTTEEGYGDTLQVEGLSNKRTVLGTISYMPAVFGCFCASAVVQDIIDK